MRPRSRPNSWNLSCSAIEQSNGAQQRKVGALEEAHGGTLFIDEIADMPRDTQNKILRVLVDQTFQRVGGSTKVAVDVRIVSSTSRNIEAEIAGGRFREDLYHRLSVVPIRVPSLAERREDIPELVDYFMEQISLSTGLPKRKIGGDAMAVLQSHDWPGNVRQLRNNVERLMILAGGERRRRHHRQHAATGRRLDGAGDAQRQRRRAAHGPAACARRANCSSANICSRRSTASAATSRAPPSSSAWSARRCIASSRRWASAEIPMSRIAYVNGRYLPLAQASVNVEDRGYQFSDGVYEVCEVRGGRLVDERRHMTRLAFSLSELRIAMPMSPAALGVVLHEVVRRNRVRWGIVYLQISRGVSRRDHAFPPAGHGAEHRRHRAQPGLRRCGENGGERRRRHLGAGKPLGARRHQVGVAAAQRAGQAGGARAGRPRSLVRGRVTATSPRARRRMPGS